MILAIIGNEDDALLTKLVLKPHSYNNVLYRQTKACCSTATTLQHHVAAAALSICSLHVIWDGALCWSVIKSIMPAASRSTTLFPSNFPTKNSNFLLMNTSCSPFPLFNFALEGIYAAPWFFLWILTMPCTTQGNVFHEVPASLLIGLTTYSWNPSAFLLPSILAYHVHHVLPHPRKRDHWSLPHFLTVTVKVTVTVTVTVMDSLFLIQAFNRQSPPKLLMKASSTQWQVLEWLFADFCTPQTVTAFCINHGLSQQPVGQLLRMISSDACSVPTLARGLVVHVPSGCVAKINIPWPWRHPFSSDACTTSWMRMFSPPDASQFPTNFEVNFPSFITAYVCLYIHVFHHLRRVLVIKKKKAWNLFMCIKFTSLQSHVNLNMEYESA